MSRSKTITMPAPKYLEDITYENINGDASTFNQTRYNLTYEYWEYKEFGHWFQESELDEIIDESERIKKNKMKGEENVLWWRQWS